MTKKPSFIKNFWSKFSDTLGFTPFHPQYLIKRHSLRFVINTMEYAKGDLVDIGCGRSTYKKYYLPHVKSYTGLDSPKTAGMYVSKIKPDIFGDILNLPIKDRSYDTVLLLEVLEHVNDPQKALQEIRRVIKRNGYLLMSIPFLYPLHDIPFDYLRYTEFFLKDLITQNGFRITKLYSRGGFIETWFLFLILNCLYKLKSLIKNPLKNVFSIALLVLFLFPIYLSINFVFWLIGLKENEKPNIFPLNYFLVAKKI